MGWQVNERQHSWGLFAEGVEQFIIGLAKKVLIADVCAISVDKMFGGPITEMPAGIAWAATFLFTLQIYFDFSGYTDMALGLGKMFGFRLPKNFNYPYSAISIQDFWRRWHITLSRWFLDYLYIPLGGNRKVLGLTIANLFTVFLLCGLWHGANITFVLWGLMHGIFLAVQRTSFGRIINNWPRFLRHLYVLSIVLVSWMIFRATSLEQVMGIGKAMLGFNGWTNTMYPLRLYADNLTLISAFAGVIFSFPVFEWLKLNWKFSIIRVVTLSLIIQTSTYFFLLLACFAFIRAQTLHAFISDSRVR